MEKITQPLKDNLPLFICSAFLFLTITNAYSQAVKYDSVTKQKYVLVDVTKTYERIIAKGYESPEIYEYLGNYYFDNNNPKKSKLYFDKLFKKYTKFQISQKSIERYKSVSFQIGMVAEFPTIKKETQLN